MYWYVALLVILNSHPPAWSNASAMTVKWRVITQTERLLHKDAQKKNCANTTNFHEIKLVSLFEYNESWFHGSTSFRGNRAAQNHWPTQAYVEYIVGHCGHFKKTALLTNTRSRRTYGSQPLVKKQKTKKQSCTCAWLFFRLLVQYYWLTIRLTMLQTFYSWYNSCTSWVKCAGPFAHSLTSRTEWYIRAPH